VSAAAAAPRRACRVLPAGCRLPRLTAAALWPSVESSPLTAGRRDRRAGAAARERHQDLSPGDHGSPSLFINCASDLKAH
jgi:hypothetical protein